MKRGKKNEEIRISGGYLVTPKRKLGIKIVSLKLLPILLIRPPFSFASKYLPKLDAEFEWIMLSEMIYDTITN